MHAWGRRHELLNPTIRQFVLARTINPDLVADAFKGYGGTVLRTTLSKEQQAKVEATLQGR